MVTDERSYRSDHAVPEELSFNNAAFFDQRNMLPFALAIGMDAGETYNGGNPPATIQGLTNTRQNSPPGTMLGAAQKAWWKATMSGSDANWKLWGNEVPLMRFFVPQGPVALLLVDRLMNCDAWDGYNHERNELMQHLLDNDIRNVVTITGDVHAHFAGLVMNDHEDVSPTPVVAEFISAGISSNTLFSFFIDATRTGNPALLRPLVAYDSTPLGGTETFVENANNLLINGSGSAVAASETHDLTAINAAADPTINTHLRYVDTNAHGYGLMTVTPTEVRATLVTVERGLVDQPPSIKRTAAFTLPSTGMGGTVSLAAPTITGKLPFPLDLA